MKKLTREGEKLEDFRQPYFNKISKDNRCLFDFFFRYNDIF